MTTQTIETANAPTPPEPEGVRVVSPPLPRLLRTKSVLGAQGLVLLAQASGIAIPEEEPRKGTTT